MLSLWCLTVAAGCGRSDEAPSDEDGDGYTVDGGDCNDHDPLVHPGHAELCNARDDDCNGLADEYLDADQDGFTPCGEDGLFGTLDDDCNDLDVAVAPGLPEICDGKDNDCDGNLPAGEADLDADLHYACATDCNDLAAEINGSAEELPCDYLDNNCDSLLHPDEMDDDQDGFDECSGDCDDGEDTVRPGAPELSCDGHDNDCDGLLHEHEADDDGDGFTECEGDCDDADSWTYPGGTEIACDYADNDCSGFFHPDEQDHDGDGFDECQGDCDDTDPSIGPTAVEVECNYIDDDCDGWLHDSEVDDDGDGFNECMGDCDDTDGSVSPIDADLDGYSPCTGDCDDSNTLVNPGRAEICDGLDNDCDPMTDEQQDDDLDGASQCDGDCDDANPDMNDRDDDGDGINTCDGDCDDADSTAFPGGVDDQTDGIDQDCDGLDGPDADGDGYAATETGGDDCDDSDPTIHPGHEGWEIDGIDSNCDGIFGTSLAHADLWFIDIEDGAHAGNALASGGNVNGDGHDDLIVGAANVGDYTHRGRAYLVLGQQYGVNNYLGNNAYFWAEHPDRSGGYDVAMAGDVNGDGLDDLLVRTMRRSYLLFGRISGWPEYLDDADVTIPGWTYPGDSPSGVAGAGDVDADGFDDFLVAHGNAANSAGEAYLVLGHASWTSLLTTMDATWPGEFDDDGVGWKMAGAGDVDGDGYEDILLGAPRNDDAGEDAGKIYTILGRTGGWPTDLGNADLAFTGEFTGDQLSVVAAAGDTNGDGYDDFLLGAPYNDDTGNEAGKVYLLHGRSTGWPADLALADATWAGEAEGDRLGWDLNSAGDVDGDGLHDLLLGAPRNADGGGESSGKTYLFFGRYGNWPGTVSAYDVAFLGEGGGQYSGASISSGDVDGDGLDDIVVGAFYNSDGACNGGKVYVLFSPF